VGSLENEIIPKLLFGNNPYIPESDELHGNLIPFSRSGKPAPCGLTSARPGSRGAE
jgi:hypothetical protein